MNTNQFINSSIAGNENGGIDFSNSKKSRGPDNSRIGDLAGSPLHREAGNSPTNLGDAVSFQDLIEGNGEAPASHDSLPQLSGQNSPAEVGTNLPEDVSTSPRLDPTVMEQGHSEREINSQSEPVGIADPIMDSANEAWARENSLELRLAEWVPSQLIPTTIGLPKKMSTSADSEMPEVFDATIPSMTNAETLAASLLPKEQLTEKNCWTHLVDWSLSEGDAQLSQSLTQTIDSVVPEMASNHMTEAKFSTQILAESTQVNSVNGVGNQRSTIAAPTTTNAVPSASQQLADNFVRDISLVTRQDSQKITMHLHPVDLGRLTVEVGWESDTVSASIVASERATSDLLNRDRQWLMNSLIASGFELSSFDVSYDESSFHEGLQDHENPDETQGRATKRASDSTPESEKIENQIRETIEESRMGLNVVA